MPINFQSPDWLAAAAWLTEQLAAVRESNDNPNWSHEQTAALRGELRFIKRMLALPEKAARREGAGSAVDRPFGEY
jgi:hypothetical protein